MKVRALRHGYHRGAGRHNGSRLRGLGEMPAIFDPHSRGNATQLKRRSQTEPNHGSARWGTRDKSNEGFEE
jgi:hypothetical protein